MEPFTMGDYKAPRDDLFMNACAEGREIAGDVLEEYFDINKPFTTGFGEISEDNIIRKEIDKYYIIKVLEEYYQFWSAIDIPSSQEIFPYQVAEKVEKEDGIWKRRF